jgi:ribosome-associated protein
MCRHGWLVIEGPTVIRIDDRIEIDPDELHFEFSRSGGPGGQNVNKVSSKVVLRWKPGESHSLPASVRMRLLASLSPRLTNEGELLIASQRTRDRSRNVADCLDKLRALVLAAARVPTERRPTRPTLASRVRRVESKSRRSETKRLRREPNHE